MNVVKLICARPLDTPKFGCQVEIDADTNIHEIMDAFESFLLAMSFSPNSVAVAFQQKAIMLSPESDNEGLEAMFLRPDGGLNES